MATSGQPSNNPYKFRLWLQNLDHDLLNDRQKREVIYFTSFGRSGCDAWNSKLASEFHVCSRTIRRDLHHLAFHSLVILSYPKIGYCFEGRLHPITKRIVKSIPYPTKSAWRLQAVRHLARRGWTKMSTYQRRTSKTSIKTTRQTSAGIGRQTTAGMSFSGTHSPTPLCGSGETARPAQGEREKPSPAANQVKANKARLDYLMKRGLPYHQAIRYLLADKEVENHETSETLPFTDSNQK